MKLVHSTNILTNQTGETSEQTPETRAQNTTSDRTPVLFHAWMNKNMQNYFKISVLSSILVSTVLN